MARDALLSWEEALAHLRAAATLVGTENLPLEEAAGRVLGEPVYSASPVPGFDNSAMDGYAVRSADLAHAQTLPVAVRAAAGEPPQTLPPRAAARIFTGAPIPAGADTVVIQEDCARVGDAVQLPPGVKPGSHIRRAGEDVRAGQLILDRGERLSPQGLGLAAACGVASLLVRRRVRVTLLSTGDELRRVEDGPLAPGQIYDSNRPMLTALLDRLACTVQSLGPIGDDFATTRATLTAAAADSDLILTTGGVSVGEEDHVKAALESAGELSLWRVAIKPGKPLAFGRLGASHVLGLPGNPVSSFVTFLLFVRPFLAALSGETLNPPVAFPVRAAFARPRPDRRREFLRARLKPEADGTLAAEVHPQQSSGALSSTVWAQGLVDIPAGGTVAPGETVRFLPFSGLLA